MHSDQKVFFLILVLIVFMGGCKRDDGKATSGNQKKCPFDPPQKEELETNCDANNIQICIEKCEGNESNAHQYCEKAGLFFYSEHNESELRRVLDLGCKKGDSLLCIDLAYTYIYKTSNPSLPYGVHDKVPFANHKQHAKIRQDTLSMIEKRCDVEKDADSCAVLSEHYKYDWPPIYVKPDHPDEFVDIIFKKNEVLILSYMKKACEYGRWDMCERMGDVYLDKIGRDLPVTFDRDQARFYYTCACENEDETACDSLKELDK